VFGKRSAEANVVMIDVQEDRATASKFTAEFGVKFPVLLDGDGSVAKKYNVTGIPTTFVLDADGNIVDSIVGAADEDRLNQALDKAK
jgi:peroxiredoxin